MYGRTYCRVWDTIGDTYTHPPKVHAFNDTPGDYNDVQRVWFRNRYYVWSAAGWTTATLASSQWKSGEWYRADDVFDAKSPDFWTMRNNSGLDYVGENEKLPASWNRGYFIKVAQEIIWEWPDGTVRARAYFPDFESWTEHLWDVEFQVSFVDHCDFR